MGPRVSHASRRSDAALFAAVDAWARLRHRRALHWTARQEPGIARRFHVALPRGMNDKWLWRKVFDHDPRFVTLCDKLATKPWVARFGVPVPRTLWAGTDARDIPPELLKGDVVVKANHASGRNILITGGQPGREEVVERANRFLRHGFGREAGEWAYAAVPRRLFVEEHLGGGTLLRDLKIYTFGRHVERVFHVVDRFGDMRADMWEDRGAGLAPYEGTIHDFEARYTGPMPATLPQALDLAARIGAEFDALRVDFLTDGQNLWLGELTVYDQGGFREYDGHLPGTYPACLWDLRRSWFMQTPQRGWREAYRRALGRQLNDADGELMHVQA
ncbi:hypothetical protein DYI42_20210 [Vannielia litorea]|nr:hypothetical protein [Vannielia litorea]